MWRTLYRIVLLDRASGPVGMLLFVLFIIGCALYGAVTKGPTP